MICAENPPKAQVRAAPIINPHLSSAAAICSKEKVIRKPEVGVAQKR
jgi:hypothetical protein